MVKVNLFYNPYLMDFVISFNGERPRINSLIEKYEKYPLQMWINRFPKILYDEMNGYDFDFEFIGPDLEYNDINNEFDRVQASSEDVRRSHMRTMESRIEKLGRIEALNSWLKENRNPNFDFDDYMQSHQEVFDDEYHMVIIGDVNVGEFKFHDTKVSMEIIGNVSELDNTNLKDIAIILEVERFPLKTLQSDVLKLIGRDDVDKKQVFFYIKNVGSVDSYQRMLVDLGIKEPLIITGMNDPNLEKYVEYYPVSDYIRGYIGALEELLIDLDSKLEDEKREVNASNSDILKNLNEIDDRINQVKGAVTDLEEIRKTNIDIDWDAEINDLKVKICEWKKKKTIISSEEEAINLSQQFEDETVNNWETFVGRIRMLTNDFKKKTQEECSAIYKEITGMSKILQGTPADYDVSEGSLESINDDLMEIREEKYEKPKEGFWGALLGTDSSSANSGEEVLVITYPCEKWREHVLQKVEPLIDGIVSERIKGLQQFKDELVDGYVSEMNSILADKQTEKKIVSEQLSEDMMVFQTDVDWLDTLRGKVVELERE